MLFRIFVVASLSFLGFAWRTSMTQPSWRYYVTVLAYQSDPKHPKTSHTFAVFSKASGEPSQGGTVESHTISWLPTSLDVDITNLKPEPGTNFGLTETLRMARDQKLTVSAWGPFPIKQELYNLAVERVQELRSGKLKFVVLDLLLAERDSAVNCIHAVSDLDPKRPVLNTGIAHGHDASKLVVAHLEPWVLKSGEDTNWLRDHLGLQKAAAGS
jgi:hypothetical protein